MIEFDIGHKYSRALSENGVSLFCFQNIVHIILGNSVNSVYINFYNISLLEPIILLHILRIFIAVVSVIAYCIPRTPRMNFIFLSGIIDNTDNNVPAVCLSYSYFETITFFIIYGPIEDILSCSWRNVGVFYFGSDCLEKFACGLLQIMKIF